MSHPPTSNDPIQHLRRLRLPCEQELLQSDAELLSLYVHGGDQRAMEILIKRYAALVASVCRVTVNDPTSAEDAFQATFLILLKSAKKIQRRASLAAWLHGVAYRTACRMRINNRRQLSNQSSLDVNAPIDLKGDPVVDLARQMELETLDRELQNLPDRLREPLIEHYLLGYTAPEIAERMELSVSAIEGRLRRGRRTLRTILARRGISLSVVLAGAAWFERHLQAAEAADWTTRLLDSHFPSGDYSSDVPTSPEVSSLVRGEMTMFSSLAIKSAFATCLMLAVGTLAIFSVNAADGTKRASGNKPAFTTLVADAQSGLPAQAPVVMAQLAGMGGIGGGGMGGEGMAAAGAETNAAGMAAFGQQGTAEPVVWEPPTEDAPTPGWLAGGNVSMQALEANRSILAEKISEISYDQEPLSSVVADLSDKLKTQIVVNESRIKNDLDLSGDMLVTLHASSITLRELLRRISQDHELSYVVTESAIEITSSDDAQVRPSMRFYDLSYILPNSANIGAVVSAIQNTIDTDSWVETGNGNSSISIVGSMMIVSSPDTTHQQIEVLLLNLARMNPRNAAKPVSPFNIWGGGMGGGGMGGMGGGMGGMGGGMGGMGGGMGGMGGGMF